MISSIVIFLLIFGVHLFNYQSPFLGYWDTYIASPAIVLTGNKLKFVDINNVSLYEYKLKNVLPNDLINYNAYGIISKDQRLGSDVFFSVPYLFFVIFGFRVYQVLLLSLGSIIFYFIIKKITTSDFAAIIGQIMLFLNSYILSIKTLSKYSWNDYFNYSNTFANTK